MRRLDHAARHGAQALFHQPRKVRDRRERQRHRRRHGPDGGARDHAREGHQRHQQDDERERAHGIHRPAQQPMHHGPVQRLPRPGQEHQHPEGPAQEDRRRQRDRQHQEGLADGHAQLGQQLHKGIQHHATSS
ncbi:hypothetical protein G6F46_015125 [Rhizopus delemar]|nr:hypothetical protein G6F46_015125 [Rhizopus delemar]